MTARARASADRAIVGVLWTLQGAATLLPSSLCLALLQLSCALGSCALWPLLAVRRRARAAGHALSPWRWGSTLGGNLAALLGVHRRLPVQGWSELGPGGTLILAAHQGAWEEGAAELARRGARPLVLAAPWPRLPRTEAAVRTLRARQGVRSAPRSRATLREATRHLRSGGCVVVLVDSLSPLRRGRRASTFVSDPVAPPDALIAWAARQGAAVLVATAAGGAVRLHALREASAPLRLTKVASRELADRVVDTLRTAVHGAPSEWAWVRALASISLMAPCFAPAPLASAAFLAFTSGCGPAVTLPSLPTTPSAWTAQLAGLSWQGSMAPAGPPAALSAARARVRLVEGGLAGAFEEVHLTMPAFETQPALDAHARSAQGAWPAGPLTLREVEFAVEGVAGRVELVRWDAQRGLRCDGCALERLLPASTP